MYSVRIRQTYFTYEAVPRGRLIRPYVLCRTFEIMVSDFRKPGDYKKRILAWIHEHHPELDELYREIYTKKSRAYWTELDQKIRAYTAKEGMLYIRDDDQHRAPFGEPPVVCNYFYHEEITKSAKRERT